MENIGLIKYGQIVNELPRLFLHIFWNNNASYYLINYGKSYNNHFVVLLQGIATNLWVWNRDEFRMIP